jgi:hypothetical protein
VAAVSAAIALVVAVAFLAMVAALLPPAFAGEAPASSDADPVEDAVPAEEPAPDAAPAAMPQPTKSALVYPAAGGLGSSDPGSAGAPVPVAVGDTIEYTIRFAAQDHPTAPPLYDMLFVLDWSASMSAGYGTDIFSQSEKARILAKQAIFGTCQALLSEYPGSRVAVMGLNSIASNSGDPARSNIQVDTEFADAANYQRLIENAFSTSNIDYNNDDNAMFLRMARDKLNGDASQAYGGAAGVPTRHVKPRVDRSRIPIIVHISDFEIADPPHPSGNVGGFWRDDDPSYTDAQKAASLNAQVRAFRQDYPSGVYLAVRADHFRHYDGSDNRFASPAWTQLMDDTIALGGANWGWRIVNKDNYQSQGSALTDLVRGAADNPLHHAAITDILPAGLEYISSMPDAAGVFDQGGRKVVIWTPTGLAAGAHEVKVWARVSQDGTFPNSATVQVDDDIAQTNETWHRAESSPPDPPDPPDPHDPPLVVTGEKSARTIPRGDGSPPASSEPGTEDDPVPVAVGDEIEYTIRLDASRAHSGAKYDVLFLLDWSRSMAHPYGELTFAPDDGPYAGLVESYPTGGLSARSAAKDTLLALSRRVLEMYPDSRVAVMGLNTYTEQGRIYTNSGRRDLVNLQVDTPFAYAADYEAVIGNAFAAEPQYEGDDNAMFFQAALDKMRGNAASYGGYASVPEKAVVPRTGAAGRVPVIVHIADFEMLELDEVRPDLHAPILRYWSTHVAPVARQYARAFPDGIYIAARANHVFHKVSALSVAYQYGLVTREEVVPDKAAGVAKAERLVYGDKLKQYALDVSPTFKGVLFDETQTPGEQTELLWDLMREEMPLHVTVDDVLPPGLSVVSTDPPATVGETSDTGRAAVRWELDDLPEGETLLKILCRVDAPGVFANKATVTAPGDGAGEDVVPDVFDTNTTWHRAGEARALRLHLRQVVLSRGNSAVELPVVGYARLDTLRAAVLIPTGVADAAHPGAPPFASFAIALPPSETTLRVTAVVPQYYEYLGHVATEGDPTAPDAPLHDPSGLRQGSPALDYSEKNEYGVTLYIRPRFGAPRAPGLYAWDLARNPFGAPQI